MSRRRALGLAAALVASALAVPAAAAAGLGSGPQAAATPPRVLVWGGSYGFRHPSITVGEKTFVELGRQTGTFTAVVTENPADLTMAVLRRYDVLAWISTTGKPPLLESQREDIIRWSACGGGNMGFHAALDADYGWAEHAELFGAQFDSHPKGAGTGAARMLVEDRGHPITQGWKGKKSFLLDDEYYRWRTAKRVPGVSLPRNDKATNVLLSLDETTVGGDIQKGPLAYEHHQPIAWTKTFRGGGRVYYNNMGHSESTWDSAPFRTALVNGVQWVGGVRPEQACLDGTSDVRSRPTPPAPARGTVGKTCPLPGTPPRKGGPTWERSEAYRALTEKGDRQTVAAGLAGNLQWGAQHWVLDLSRSRAQRADVTVRLTWPAPADDYDLSVTTPWGFYGSHEPVGTTTETLVLKGVPHCGNLQTYADNMYGVSGQAPTLTATVVPQGRARTRA